MEPNQTVTQFVSREHDACGHRVTALHSSVNSLTYAIRTLPDMVIASAELDKITGIDLPYAISAKSLARKRPFYLLTSIDKARAALRTMPGAIAVKKGGPLSNDLGDALEQTDIT